MITVHCHTNLDIREEWPNKLYCRPIVGDIIISKSGLELEVCRIKHNTYKEGSVGYLSGGRQYLEVELHLVPHRFENISHFTIWYRNLFNRDINGPNGDHYRKMYQLEMDSLHERTRGSL